MAKHPFFIVAIFLVGCMISLARASSTNLGAQYNRHVTSIDPLIQEKKYREAGRYIVTQVTGDRRLFLAVASYLGQEIYKQEGIDGFSVCFNMAYEASFACEHGLISEMFARDDASFARTLDSCFKIPNKDEQGACIHMMGHALAARTDYSIGGITEAMEMCQQYKESTGGDDSSGSCQSGVAMEYFLARLGSSGKGVNHDIVRDTRMTFDKFQPYDICAQLSEKDACYNHIVSWWLTGVKLSRQEVAALCLAVEPESSRQSCLTMLGKYIVGDTMGKLFGEVNKTSSLLACKAMEDREERKSCYDSRLISPRRGEFISSAKEQCAELALGRYENLCQEVVEGDMRIFDYY